MKSFIITYSATDSLHRACLRFGARAQSAFWGHGTACWRISSTIARKAWRGNFCRKRASPAAVCARRRAKSSEKEQIMDFLSSNSMAMLEKSMNFLWTKQAALSDNISNAETPNYKPKVVTFEESLRNKLNQAAAGPNAKQNVRPILAHSEFAVSRVCADGRQRRQCHRADGGSDAELLSAAVCIQQHQFQSKYPAHGCARAIRRGVTFYGFFEHSQYHRLRPDGPAAETGYCIGKYYKLQHHPSRKRRRRLSPQNGGV